MKMLILLGRCAFSGSDLGSGSGPVLIRFSESDDFTW